MFQRHKGRIYNIFIHYVRFREWEYLRRYQSNALSLTSLAIDIDSQRRELYDAIGRRWSKLHSWQQYRIKKEIPCSTVRYYIVRRACSREAPLIRVLDFPATILYSLSSSKFTRSCWTFLVSQKSILLRFICVSFFFFLLKNLPNSEFPAK